MPVISIYYTCLFFWRTFQSSGGKNCQNLRRKKGRHNKYNLFAMKELECLFLHTYTSTCTLQVIQGPTTDTKTILGSIGDSRTIKTESHTFIYYWVLYTARSRFICVRHKDRQVCHCRQNKKHHLFNQVIIIFSFFIQVHM